MPPKRKAAAPKKKSEEFDDEVSSSSDTTNKHNKQNEVPETSGDGKPKSERKQRPSEVLIETGNPSKQLPEKVAEVENKLFHDSEEVTVPKKKKTANSESEPKALLNQTETSYGNIAFACKKLNKLGKTSNFCISNWNVDGLRAWLKKGGLTYLEYEKPDIFCIQESKCSTEKLPSEIKNLSDYKQYWHNSSKEGYAGVGLFTRPEPISVEYGVGDKEHDEEGRCITAEFDKFFVVSTYVPNAGRKLVTLPKRLEWNAAFKKFVKDLDKKKPVIICGDMNVAHNEIDLANPKTNTKNAGFTKEEREGMTDFLAGGYVDTFRSLYPEKKDAYTFWSYMTKARAKNVGWRLDYFIVSHRMLGNVCDNVIRSEVFGSDHCPIALFLNV